MIYDIWLLYTYTDNMIRFDTMIWAIVIWYDTCNIYHLLILADTNNPKP